MALEMKGTSSWWYGRFMVHRKLRRINLGVRIEGDRPSSITQEGNRTFERSRGRAQSEHDRVRDEILSKKTTEELTQRIIEIKSGSRLTSPKVAMLEEAWINLPRKKLPTAVHISGCTAKLRRFIEYMATDFPDTDELIAVRAAQVKLFMDQEEERGISARTWNITLGLLRGLFRKLTPSADAYVNYLSVTPKKEENPIHRKPFSAEEIQTILVASSDDALMRPMIVTALATALRLGDLAQLKWSDVDLEAGFIAVRSSKTGESVEIPILPALHDELVRIERSDNQNVFPAAVEFYRKRGAHLNQRLKAILAKAGVVDDQSDGNSKVAPRLVSGSTRGWHSFRTTFITLALSAGMPEELVRRVTGHATVDVVRKHYFRPGREQFRKAMQKAMPKLFLDGQTSAREEMGEIIKGMTAKTLETDKECLLKLLS